MIIVCTEVLSTLQYKTEIIITKNQYTNAIRKYICCDHNIKLGFTIYKI